jgi:hypothetical protein
MPNIKSINYAKCYHLKAKNIKLERIELEGCNSKIIIIQILLKSYMYL